MNLAIMQPYFAPYIGYIQLLNAVDIFVIYDDVNFINKGWINRNNILINAKRTLITIPLKEASQNKLIKETEISYENNWREKNLKTIEFSYKRAPFFLPVFHLFQKSIKIETDSIASFNIVLLKNICEYLQVKTVFVETSSVYENTHLKGQDRILDICLKENASHYINPIGGLELYKKNEFQERNIKLSFIKPNPVEYKQFDNPFVAWLSIIDVMMFNSKEEVKKMIDNYSLQ